MGAWGPSIYSDDLAADIRHEYNTLISFGKENEEIEEILIKYYGDILGCGDPDESVFWYALSLCEWKKGRLSMRAKENALACLEKGNDLRRWDFPGNENNYRKRLQVLEKFKNTILSPMPEKKKARKPTVHHCPWKEGSLLAYRIITNEDVSDHPCLKKYALLRVIRIKRRPISNICPNEYYNESMLVGLYGWIGESIPEQEIVDELEFIPVKDYIPKNIPVFDNFFLGNFFENSNEIKIQVEENLSLRRVETCAQLDWRPSKNSVGDITYLGRDESYEQNIPEFFKTSITDYSLTHFWPFDATLVKRLEPYLKKIISVKTPKGYTYTTNYDDLGRVTS